MRFGRWSTAFVVALCMAGVGMAEAGPREDNAVKARRGYYQMLLWDFGPMTQVLKGEVAFDAAVAKNHAQGLAALADFNVDRLFMTGSSKDDKAGATRALPAIWTQRDRFTQLQTEWQDKARALLASVDEGEAAFKQRVADLGQTCKACHDDFRARDF